MHQLFTNRRLLSLTIILIVSILAITGVSLFVIYSRSLITLKTTLVDIVERQKSLIEVLHEEGKDQAEIITILKKMRKKHFGIGNTGELAIARQIGDHLNYLLSLNENLNININNSQRSGIPMCLAIQGNDGFVIAQDYRNIKVLAAYTYVPILKWGIVAKIPTSEINQPYYNAMSIALTVSICLTSFCVYLFIRISNPIIKEIINNEEKFSRSIKFAPIPIMIHSDDGEVMNISNGWTDITGYSLMEIPTTEEWTLRAFGERKLIVKEYIDSLYGLDRSIDEGEYSIICKNGTTRIWDFSSAPLGKLKDGRRAVISIAKDITERRQAEEALKESEYFFKESQKAAFIGSYKTDFVKGYWVSSEVLDQIFGIDKDYNRNIQGWLDIVHPDDKKMMDLYLREIISNRQPFNKEYRIIRIPDSETRWIFGMGIVEFDSKGDIISMIGTIQDITQRKHAEFLLQEKNYEIEAQNEEYRQINEELQKAKEKVEESEKRLLSIIDNTDAGYFFIDNNGLFQNVNRAWLNLYKYEKFDEVIGRHFADVQQIADMENALQFVEGIRNGSPAFMNGDFSRLCKDKSIGYHSFSARPVYINNKITGIEGFIIDITKQKEIEKELITSKEIAERNEQKFRSLFTSMQEGVYLHEIIYDDLGKAVNYRIIECNPISEKYLNIKTENAIGKLATELFGTSEAPFLDTYAQVAETTEPVSFEQYFEPMNKYFLISVFSPNKGEFATVFLDITKNKNYETELITAKEKAEESDRLKTAFLQNMSHEIRTPMNAIMGFSELIVNNYNDKSKLQKFSEIINLRCNDLLNIVNDILDIAKIESGQQLINFDECNLHVMFAELMQFYGEYQKRIGKQHIKFNLQVQSQPSASIIITDPVKLKQILINLISNAFKFTDFGSIEGGCKFDETNNLIFYVSDTGIGIPPDKQEFIFERFAQVEKGSNRLYGGTGLGLSIVKGLINLLGGEIYLQSDVGKGSTFSFTIPFKTAPLLHHDPIAIKNAYEYNFMNKTILIVEDDQYNTEYIKEILINAKLKILQTDFGKEAIKISLSQPVDLVLMDIRLPDIDGYKATSQIRQQKPQLKIIAQTAYASHNERQKALDAGCNDYISKPIKSDILLTMLQKYLYL